MIFLFWLILILSLFGFNPISSLNLSHRGYTNVPPDIGYEIQIDLSQNKIERIDKPVFDPKTQEIYLNDNLISYINPDVFRDLYNISYLDLTNNRLHSFEIDFNFVNGQNKRTIVNLNANLNLTLLSK